MITIKRLSPLLTSQSSLQQLNDLRRQSLKVQTQLTLGTRLLSVSDEPSQLAQADQLAAGISRLQLFKENGSYAQGFQEAAERGIGEANEVMKTLRAMAVWGASDTADGQRATRLSELKQLREELITAGNTRFDERYVFAGRAYDSPPFDQTGAYSGDSDSPQTRIGDQRWTETGWDGEAIFDGPSQIMDVLDQFEAALAADDGQAVRDLLPRFDDALAQLSESRSVLGLTIQETQDQIYQSEDLEIALIERREALTGVDPYQAADEFERLRGAVDITLQVLRQSNSSQSLFELL